MTTATICSLCEKVPERLSSFHCPHKQFYCDYCCRNVRLKSEDHDQYDEPICKQCQSQRTSASQFSRMPETLSIAKDRSEFSTSSSVANSVVTVDSLFGFNFPEQNPIKSLLPHCSKFHKPIVCPHSSCRKTVAISSFANHFRYEHPELKKYAVEPNGEVTLPFDVSAVRRGRSSCFAILTVYEASGKVDLVGSKSTNSVIRTCRQFCRTVPVDSFWLMSSGAKCAKKSRSYVLVWIFSNSSKRYFSTIELSSKNDGVSFSHFGAVNDVPENVEVEDVARSLNCLRMDYGAIVGLLSEGRELNLRILVHST